MLRQLLLIPAVQFAGYKVPHPLEPRVVLKVQTDGSKTPVVAVQEAINNLVLLLGKIKGQFQQELLKHKALEGTEDQFGGAGEGFF
ncbi:DNA-directed RNA polymerase II core subunit [Rhodotorula kratochvilovae]